MDNPIPFAFDEHGRFIHISQAKANGLACDCTCPGCGCRLVAKREGSKKRPHFAHYGQEECPGARETVLHLLAKEVIAEEKCLMLPAFKNLADYRKQRFVHVRTEERNDRSDLQPDAEGITQEGDIILIEFKVTHAVDEVKTEKIRQTGRMCVEIDLNHVEMDKEAMRRFLTDDPTQRWWISNPRLERIWQHEQERQAEQRRQKEEKMRQAEERRKAEQLELQKALINDFRERHPEYCYFWEQRRCNECPLNTVLQKWNERNAWIRPYMPSWGEFYLRMMPYKAAWCGDVLHKTRNGHVYVLDEHDHRQYLYPKAPTPQQKLVSDKLYCFFKNFSHNAFELLHLFHCDYLYEGKTFKYDDKTYIACSNPNAKFQKE